MTTTRRPRPSFSRIPRARFDEHLAALETQRDRALAARRAHADWIASWLEQRAAFYRQDADHIDRLGVTGQGLTAHQRRVIAQELEQLVIDMPELRDAEEGPR